METWDLLARHHRRAVDEFFEAVLDGMDLDGVERNVLGVALRSEVENRLAPGLFAVAALLLEADADALGQLPVWLDRVQTVLPADAEFLTEMGRRVDPAGAALLTENLGLLPGESETGRWFRNFLWEMAPMVDRPGPRCFCQSRG